MYGDGWGDPMSDIRMQAQLVRFRTELAHLVMLALKGQPCTQANLQEIHEKWKSDPEHAAFDKLNNILKEDGVPVPEIDDFHTFHRHMQAIACQLIESWQIEDIRAMVTPDS